MTTRRRVLALAPVGLGLTAAALADEPDEPAASAEARAEGRVLARQAEAQISLLRQTLLDLREARRHSAQPAGEALERAVSRAFNADPEVAEVSRGLKEAKDRLAEVSRMVRNAKGDPVGARWLKRQAELEQRHADLWAAKAPGLRARLGQPPAAPKAVDRMLDQLDSIRRGLHGEDGP